MVTTSTNFKLQIATQSDIVDVDSHVAGNFSNLDTAVGSVVASSGGLKSGLVYAAPTLVNPVISGTMTGANLIVASTARLNTITATGGTLTVSTFSIGTYSYPATIGIAGAALFVVTSNAVWQVNAATGTGADTNLANLVGPVAINTNLNTFTAGFVTVARVIATSGALTGLTSFQATTGTFAGNLVISGTATVNVINVTGGTITAGALSIGTYSYPATVGSTNQTLIVTTGNLVFASQQATAAMTVVAMTSFTVNSNTHTTVAITSGALYDISISMTMGAGNCPVLAINGETGPSSYQVGTGTSFSMPLTATATTGATADSFLLANVRLDTRLRSGKAAFMYGQSLFKEEGTANRVSPTVFGIYDLTTAASTVGIYTKVGAGTGVMTVYRVSTS